MYNLSPKINRYKIGDYIEFSKQKNIDFNKDYNIYRGVIVSLISDMNLLEVKVHPDGEICWIPGGSIIHHYPKSTVQNLSCRLVFKEKWRNLVFREVKAVKCRDIITIRYDYINEDGFVRHRYFDDINTAFETIPYYYHSNIHILYEDYFGFTTHVAQRDNDVYQDQEIFFSKKCYSELVLAGDYISANFKHTRAYKHVPPRAKQYVCGLVEHGEKGLFYRKWFICSPEFMTLWTMINQPNHHSLKKYHNNTYVTRTLPELLELLDTSKYYTTSPYKSYNVESAVCNIENVYKNIASLLFGSAPSDNNEEYCNINQQMYRDILWVKHDQNETENPKIA